MTEIKLTKRYPQSRTEDIVDAYMRGWNDALDAVQNGKFIINDDRKTEPTISKMEQVDKDINVRSKDEPNYSEKTNNCEPQTYKINPKEPTNMPKCFDCEDFFTCDGQCDEIECEKCKHFREEADTYTKQCEFYFMECKYEPKDEPQTCDDCIWNYCNYNKVDWERTDTEIAKAIVHKMIDDAVIAEDAYPDLRQKMHDAVDEYEPQTERSE